MVSLFELCARIPTLRHLPCGFGGLNIKLFGAIAKILFSLLILFAFPRSAMLRASVARLPRLPRLPDLPDLPDLQINKPPTTGSLSRHFW